MLSTPAKMAAFSQWANHRIYASCEALTPAQLAEDRGAFFRSVIGTLNHILLVDILYRERWDGVKSGFTTLDEILHDDLAALSEAQRAEERYYLERCAGVDASALERPIGFHTLLDDGEYWEVSLSTYLSNLFQHQVHHRAQVHTLLSQFGIDPPPIGYIEYEIERGQGVARRSVSSPAP